MRSHASEWAVGNAATKTESLRVPPILTELGVKVKPPMVTTVHNVIEG